MRKIFSILFSMILSAIVSSCTRIQKAVIYETDHNDKKFRIQQCIRKTYISNYLYYRFIMGNSTPLEVNSLDDQHGLPYKPDVFNGAPAILFDTAVNYCVIENPEKLFEEDSANAEGYTEAASMRKYMKEEIYKNLKTERKRFLLYLDPKEYSLDEFNEMGKVMSLHSKEINDLIFSCKPFQSTGRGNYDGWQFCGIVYGNEVDFCEVYTKNKEDFFKVFPDGRISHYNELAIPGKNWMSGQDYIYTQIKMPGKFIQLRKYTKDDLLPYKNSKGQSIIENFQVEQGPPEISNN